MNRMPLRHHDETDRKLGLSEREFRLVYYLMTKYGRSKGAVLAAPLLRRIRRSAAIVHQADRGYTPGEMIRGNGGVKPCGSRATVALQLSYWERLGFRSIIEPGGRIDNSELRLKRGSSASCCIRGLYLADKVKAAVVESEVEPESLLDWLRSAASEGHRLSPKRTLHNLVGLIRITSVGLGRSQITPPLELPRFLDRVARSAKSEAQCLVVSGRRLRLDRASREWFASHEPSWKLTRIPSLVGWLDTVERSLWMCSRPRFKTLTSSLTTGLLDYYPRGYRPHTPFEWIAPT